MFLFVPNSCLFSRQPLPSRRGLAVVLVARDARALEEVEELVRREGREVRVVVAELSREEEVDRVVKKVQAMCGVLCAVLSVE